MVRTFALRLLTCLISGIASAGVEAQIALHAHDGPVFTADEMRRGISTSRSACESYPSTVFVVASGRDICFRCYLSTEGGMTPEAVYFLQGDHPADKLDFEPVNLDRFA